MAVLCNERGAFAWGQIWACPGRFFYDRGLSGFFSKINDVQRLDLGESHCLGIAVLDVWSKIIWQGLVQNWFLCVTSNRDLKECWLQRVTTSTLRGAAETYVAQAQYWGQNFLFYIHTSTCAPNASMPMPPSFHFLWVGGISASAL